MNEFSGALGEVLAGRYLRDRGYEIACANYRTRLGELDLVAEKDGVRCFVEVKTRSEGMIAPPSESVGREKQRRIAMAAAQYLRREKADLLSRFDVIEVYLDADGGLKEINHIQNAFDSTI
ncbi:MAG: YraN family protein [Clostridia bacterium]|nr:YraN family protein [Clostridia bacterium]